MIEMHQYSSEIQGKLSFLKRSTGIPLYMEQNFISTQLPCTVHLHVHAVILSANQMAAVQRIHFLHCDAATYLTD